MRKDERDKDGKDQGGIGRTPISPERLIDATDAILVALEEYKIDTRGGTIAPVELLGLPNQPKALCDYTRTEIEQASAFLMRLGVLEPQRARKA